MIIADEQKTGTYFFSRLIFFNESNLISSLAQNSRNNCFVIGWRKVDLRNFRFGEVLEPGSLCSKNEKKLIVITSFAQNYSNASIRLNLRHNNSNKDALIRSCNLIFWPEIYFIDYYHVRSTKTLKLAALDSKLDTLVSAVSFKCGALRNKYVSKKLSNPGTRMTLFEDCLGKLFNNNM